MERRTHTLAGKILGKPNAFLVFNICTHSLAEIFNCRSVIKFNFGQYK